MKPRYVVALWAVLALAGTAHAADFDFSGTFSKDNDIGKFDFTVGAPSALTIFSSSWVTGGFDPILTLWDAAGNFISEQDDIHAVGAAVSNGTSYNYGVWDSYLSVILPAGNYFVTVAQYDNFANGPTFADGFLQDAEPHFTLVNGWGTQPNFNGTQDLLDSRTGDFAFHIVGVQSSSVPDGGSSFALLSLALAGLAGVRKGLGKR